MRKRMAKFVVRYTPYFSGCVCVLLFIAVHLDGPDSKKARTTPPNTIPSMNPYFMQRPPDMKIPKHFNRQFVDPFDLKRVVSGNSFTCVDLKYSPKIPVCVFDNKDKMSDVLRYQGAYEKDLTDVFVRLLATNRSLGFINIGAGVGYYSLIAAALGHPGVVVEPLPYNLVRLRASAHMGDRQNSMAVLRNAVSNIHDIYPVYFKDSDIGGATLRNAHVACKSKTGGCPVTKTIYLDDLLPFTTFTKAILKLDIAGYEARALQRAQVLFDKIVITHVLMKGDAIATICKADTDIQKEMMRFLEERGYTPSDAISKEVLDPETCSKWSGEVLWTRSAKRKVPFKEYNRYPAPKQAESLQFGEEGKFFDHE